MPSNYTENYSLNQWSKSDQVKMEDFNADNARIDGALAGKIGRPELIWEYEQTEGSVSQHKVDLTNIDWDQWTFVAVILSPRWLGSSNSKVTISLSVGLNLSSAPGDGIMGPRCALFIPNHNKNNIVRMFCFPGGSLAESPSTFEMLKYIQFVYSGQDAMRDETKIQIYGLP